MGVSLEPPEGTRFVPSGKSLPNGWPAALDCGRAGQPGGGSNAPFRASGNSSQVVA